MPEEKAAKFPCCWNQLDDPERKPDAHEERSVADARCLSRQRLENQTKL